MDFKKLSRANVKRSHYINKSPSQRSMAKLKEKLKVKLKERIQEKLKNKDVNIHHHQNGIETGEIGKDDNIGKDENDIISDRKDLIDAIDHENFRDSMSPAD